MQKIILSILYLLPLVLQAANHSEFYQIDIIGFTHEHQENAAQELPSKPPLLLGNTKSIPLQSDFIKSNTPYHLRSTSTSSLKREYYALARQKDYKILFHYTWLQPATNQRAVKLPKIIHDNWQVEGTLRIRQSNYFLLDTDLYFSTSNSSHPPFVFNQKKRLKGGSLYYLDHPQAGMIVKIHKLS